MKTKKLIMVILLWAMGFSTLHAYAIDFLDRDHCSVSEYVDEINQASEHDEQGDVCQVHHEFHVAYILPKPTSLQTQTLHEIAELSTPLKYKFHSYKYFLKPPIHSF